MLGTFLGKIPVYINTRQGRVESNSTKLNNEQHLQKRYSSHKLVSSKAVAKYIKPELFEMKGEIAKNKIIVGNFDISVSKLNKASTFKKVKTWRICIIQ